ncbi:MAG: hypothetical protein ACON39_01160 [Coraliomargaritaceae bacterium]
MKESNKRIEVPWHKFNLAQLETEHPAIFHAYKVSRQQKKEVFIGLGVYEDAVRPEDWRKTLHSVLEEEVSLTVSIRKSETKRIERHDKLIQLWLIEGKREHRYSNYGFLTGYEYYFTTSYKNLFGVFSGYYREGVNETHARVVYELLVENVNQLSGFEEKMAVLEKQAHSEAFTMQKMLHLRLDRRMQDFLSLLKQLRMGTKTIRHSHKTAILRIYDFVYTDE